MNKLVMFGASAALLLPALGFAQSAFDGTWKADIGSAQLPEKPDVYLLKDGVYRCDTCVPAIVAKADGTDQKVTGHPYYDTVSVRIIDARTIERTDKKAGKPVNVTKLVVSPDGRSATVDITDSSASTTPVTGKGVLTRVGSPQPGTHIISGSWRTTKWSTVSDNGLLVTYKGDATSLTMTNPLGQTYTARLDGSDAPYVGDPGLTSVSLRSINKSTIEESDKLNGKVVWVGRISVAGDGNTMNVVWIDNLHGTTGSYMAKKQ